MATQPLTAGSPQTTLPPVSLPALVDPPVPQTKPAVPTQEKYVPLFRYDSVDQTDRDTFGDLTPQAGKVLGQTWGSDHVEELNFWGKVVPYAQFSQVEGGEELAKLMAARRTGRRGFWEAMVSGSGWDFVPYASDVAAVGISIKNMARTRNALATLRDKGPEGLSLQDLVLTKLFLEHSDREAQQTFLGNVGSMLRAGPAFAFEFFTSGAIFKGASKLATMAVKETTETIVEKSAAYGVRMTAKALAAKTGKTMVTAEDVGLDNIVKEAMQYGEARMAGATLDATARAALKVRAVSAAEKALAIYNNPSILRATGRFLAEYSRAGLRNHMDEVVHGLPPTVRAKVREAAGIALIEGPIRAGLYAGFDYGVAHPIIGALAGADETVTRSELGFAVSGDEETDRAAKMYAFGSAWASYLAMTSARAFNALGGIVSDTAKQIGNRAVAKGLRARPDAVQQGTYVRELIDAVYGTDDQLRAAVRDQQKRAVLDAAKAPGGIKNAAGKTLSVPEALADPEVTQRLLREKLQFQQKSIWGYWLASKMTEGGVTPTSIQKLFESMGYGEVLGMFGGARYGGFIQGIMGLTGEEPQSVRERLAAGLHAAIPTTSQGFAEIVSFAVPAVLRAGMLKAYSGLNASAFGRAREFADRLNDLASIKGLQYYRDAEAPTIVDVATTGSKDNIAERLYAGSRTKVGRAQYLTDVQQLAETFRDFFPEYKRIIEDERTVGQRAAGWVIGLVNAAVTGDPMTAFRDPMRAILHERLGNDGRALLTVASMWHKHLYRAEMGRRSAARAQGVHDAPGREPDRPTLVDPSIEAAITPEFTKQLTDMLHVYLRQRGAFVASEGEVREFLKRLPRDAQGKIAGRTPEEFQKEFETELLQAASGRLKFDIIGDRVGTVYSAPEKTTLSQVTDALEQFLASRGVVTYTDVSTIGDFGAFHTAYSGRGMDRALLEAAARNDGSVESDAAQRQLLRESVSNLTLFTEHDIRRAGNYVSDFARTLLALNERLLRPVYETADGTRVYEVTGSDGAFLLADPETGEIAPGARSVQSRAEAQAQATTLGLTAREGRIFFTPTNAVYGTSALQLAAVPWIRPYMLKTEKTRALANLPYARVGRAGPDGLTLVEARRLMDEQFALAKKWDESGRRADAFATPEEAQAAQKAWVALFNDPTAEGGVKDRPLGAELLARQALEESGAARHIAQNPGDRGQYGYLVTPGAVSFGGDVYIPFKHVGNTTAVIEDAIESAVRRLDRLGVAGEVIAGLFRDPRLAEKYRPAAREFIKNIHDALKRLSENANRVSDTTLREAAYLAEYIFNPDAYNLEAISHAIAGFVFYRADEALAQTLGFGGSKYYATLGLIADEVRGRADDGTAVREAFLTFNSLVNQLLGAGSLRDADSVLAATLTALAPAGQRDQARLRVLPTSQEVAEFLGPNSAIPADAISSLKSMTPEQATQVIETELRALYAGGATRTSYLPEDRRALARGIAEVQRGKLEIKGAAEVVKERAAAETLSAGDASTAAASATSAASAAATASTATTASAATVAAAESTPPTAGKSASVAEALHDPDQVGLMVKFAELAMRSPGFNFGVRASDYGTDGLRASFEFYRRLEPSMPATDIDKMRLAYVQADERRASLQAYQTFNDDADAAVADAEQGIATWGDNAARDMFGRNSTKRAVVNLMRLFAPGSMGEATKMLELLYRPSLVMGRALPDSIAGLLSGVDTDLRTHALLRNEESYNLWLRPRLLAHGLVEPREGETGDRRQKGAGHEGADGSSQQYRAFYLLLHTLGYEGSLRLMTTLRGATQVAGVSFREPQPKRANLTDSGASWENDDDADAVSQLTSMRVHRRSGSLDAPSTGATGLARTHDRSLPQTKATLQQIAKDAEAVITRHMNTPMPTLLDLSARRVEVARRFEEVAKLADRLFGVDNFFATALRDPAVVREVAEHRSKAGGVAGSSLDMWFASWLTGGKNYGGALARWVRDVALAYQFPEISAADAISRLTADNIHTGKATNQGAFPSLLNRYASKISMGQVRGIGRTASLVHVVAPTQSPVMTRILASDWLTRGVQTFFPAEAVSAQTHPEHASYLQALAQARRFAVWPDGTPIFANTVGMTDAAGVESPEPQERAVLRAAIAAHNAGSTYTYLPLHKADKKHALAILVPRAHLTAGRDTYAETYRTVAELLGVDERGRLPFNQKRSGQMFNGMGPIVPAPTRFRMLVVIPDTYSGEEGDTSFYGTLYGAGAVMRTAHTLTGTLRGRSEQHIEKLHYLSMDGEWFMGKGTTIRADEQTLADPSRTPADKWAMRLALSRVTEQSPSTLVSDLDGAKEGPLANKRDLAEAKGQTVAAWIRGSPDVTPETEVTWRGKKTTLSKILPGLTIERNVKTGEGGRPAIIISYDTNVRAMQAASLYDSAVPSNHDFYANHRRDGDMYTQAELYWMAERLNEAFDTKFPKPRKGLGDDQRDPILGDLVRRGLIPEEGPAAKSQVVKSLGSELVPSMPLVWGIKAVNQGQGKVRLQDGQPVYDADGNLLVDNPFGGDHPLTRPPRWVDQGETATPYGGKRFLFLPALLQANIAHPMFRGTSLGVNLQHQFFKGATDDAAAKMLVERLTLLEKLARDPAAHDEYLRMLAEDIMPLFLDPSGKPMDARRVLSFSDLFDAQGSFYWDALDWGQFDGPGKPKRGMMLHGGLAIVARTPSGDGGSAVILARIVGPATTAPAGGRQRWARPQRGKKGERTLQVLDTPAIDALAPADEAIVRDVPGMERQTGNDRDGDTAAVALFRMDPFGRIMRGQWSLEDLEKALADMTSSDVQRRANETEARYTQRVKAVAEWKRDMYMALLQNSIMESRVSWLRNMDPTRVEGPQPKQGVAYDKDGTDGGFPTIADPMSPEYKRQLVQAVREKTVAALRKQDKKAEADALEKSSGWRADTDFRDPWQVAAMSDEGITGSTDRGTGVDQVANLAVMHTLLGARLEKPLNAGRPLFFGDDGAPIPLPDGDLTQGHKPEEWRAFLRFAAAGNNMLFDILKGNGESALYKIGYPYLDLYIPLLYRAKPKTQEQFEKFHAAYLAAMDTKVMQAYANQAWQAKDSQHPATFQDSKLAERMMAALLQGSPRRMTALEALPGPVQTSVAAAVAEASSLAQAAGRDSREAALRTFDGLVEILGFSHGAGAVADVFEPRAKYFAGPAMLESYLRRVTSAEVFRKRLAADRGFEPNGLWDRRIHMSARWERQARQAFRGHYDESVLNWYIKKGELERQAADTPMDQRAQKAAMADAAVRLTPVEIGEMVETLLTGVADADRTVTFIQSVEGIYADMFQAYAQARRDGKLRGPNGHSVINPALDNLLAPCAQNGGSFIALRAADDATVALPRLAGGFEALRTWNPDNKLLNVKVGNLTVTPRDMYYLLRLYGSIVTMVTPKLTRSARSFMAAMGPDANADLHFAQARALDGPQAEYLFDGEPNGRSIGGRALKLTLARMAVVTPPRGAQSTTVGTARNYEVPDVLNLDHGALAWGTHTTGALRDWYVKERQGRLPTGEAVPVTLLKEDAPPPVLDVPKPSYDTMTLAEAERLYLENGDEQALRRTEALASQPAAWTHARFAQNGYEVSSKGDRRFSALFARLKDGRTIEEAYQLDVKGYRTQSNNWQAGKGKPAINGKSYDQLYTEYKDLWARFLDENPALERDLRTQANGRVLTDQFATSPVSQARALAELLTERPAPAAALEPPTRPIVTADSAARTGLDLIAANAAKIKSKLRAYLADPQAEADNRGVRETNAATETAEALRAIAKLDWATGEIGTAFEAGARIIENMRYPDPAVITGTMLAAIAAARRANQSNAMTEIQSTLAGPGAALYRTVMDGRTPTLAAKEAKAAAGTPGRVMDESVLHYALAASPEVKFVPEVNAGLATRLAKAFERPLSDGATASLSEPDASADRIPVESLMEKAADRARAELMKASAIGFVPARPRAPEMTASLAENPTFESALQQALVDNLGPVGGTTLSDRDRRLAYLGLMRATKTGALAEQTRWLWQHEPDFERTVVSQVQQTILMIAQSPLEKSQQEALRSVLRASLQGDRLADRRTAMKSISMRTKRAYGMLADMSDTSDPAIQAFRATAHLARSAIATRQAFKDIVAPPRTTAETQVDQQAAAVRRAQDLDRAIHAEMPEYTAWQDSTLARPEFAGWADNSNATKLRARVFLGAGMDAAAELAAALSGLRDQLVQTPRLGTVASALKALIDAVVQPDGTFVQVDPQRMPDEAFARLMNRFSAQQVTIAKQLTKMRADAEALPDTSRADALSYVQTAETALLTASSLGRATLSALRGDPAIAAVAEGRDRALTPPKNVPPTPPTLKEQHDLLEVHALNPERGRVDPEHEFLVSFQDPDVWFSGAVFPDFDGVDIRSLLLDKTALGSIPAAIAASNWLTQLLGLGGENGYITRAEVQSGLGATLVDGAWVVRPTDQKVTRNHRQTLGAELVRINRGEESPHMLNDEEFIIAKWFSTVVSTFICDGGYNGRTATAGEIQLRQLPWDDLYPTVSLLPGQPPQTLDANIAKIVSLEEALRRSQLPANKQQGANQFLAVHKTLLTLRNALPHESLYRKFEAALQGAIKVAVLNPHIKMGDVAAREQAAVRELERTGWAVTRRRRGALSDDSPTLYDPRPAIPVRESEALFKSSTAYRKLVEQNGRNPTELDMQFIATKIRTAMENVTRHARSMGWLVNGDGRLFGSSAYTPFVAGYGALKYWAQKLHKPEPPEFTQAVSDEMARLRPMVEKTRQRRPIYGPEEVDSEGQQIQPVIGYTDKRDLSASEAAQQPGFVGMFKFLADLAASQEGVPNPFKANATALEIAETIRHGRATDLGLSSDATAWDVAKAVYRLGVNQLYRTAWQGGTENNLSMENAGLHALTRAIAEQIAQSGEAEATAGVTHSTIYDITGALPMNLGADELLARHAQDTANATRYRQAVNQLLFANDETGRPLVYAKPGANPNDDTVPERVWELVARRWVRVHGDPTANTITYNESQTGRENAARLYDLIVPGKLTTTSEQQSAHGVRRYVFTDKIVIPPGMETFEKIAAAANPVGDDTKAVMDVFGGGEAANIVRQTLAIPNFGNPGAQLHWLNSTLSWSKSISVMASLFFPIATAFESPWAATGFWPTVLGFSRSGSRFMRSASEGDGFLAKIFRAGGMDPNAPGMREILRAIGSDDPSLVEMKTQAMLAGLMFNDRARNMLDSDRRVLARDIKGVVDNVRATMGSRAARNARALLEGALEHSSELAFEYVINATKLAVFTQMNNILRRKAIEAGRWWDPVRDMKRWAHYINSEVGGIDPAMYPWMTPKMQRTWKTLLFSWEWTLGAWEAGGGNLLTQKLFGQTHNAEFRKFLFGRWVRMYGGVMLGVPVFLQMMSTAAAKAAGVKTDDDKWFAWQNEAGKGDAARMTWDITPLLRMMAKAPALPTAVGGAGLAGAMLGGLPGAAGYAAAGAAAAAMAGWGGKTLGDVKKTTLPAIGQGPLAVPVGNLIPALTGQEGPANTTTRMRRYYFNLGKQGWEVAGWFADPFSTFLGKMSMPAQRMIEGVFGKSPGTGMDMPFKDVSFWKRWLSIDSEKSASLNLVRAFTPFSAMGVAQKPEAGLLSAVGVTSKGMSKTAAIKKMAERFTEWANADSYMALLRGRPYALGSKADAPQQAFTDLRAMVIEEMEAIRRNGYNPQEALKDALSVARTPLYRRIHNALPAFPEGTGNLRELEEVARSLYRLDVIFKNLAASIRTNDKSQNIDRRGKTLDMTRELLREAFQNPYGRKTDPRLKQSAALGGDVSGMLATDKVPETILGYRIVPTAELTPEDLKFFKDNPEAAGHFRLTGRKADANAR